MGITSAMIFFYLSTRGNQVLCDWDDPGLAVGSPPRLYCGGEPGRAGLLVVDSYDRFLAMEKSDQCAYVVACGPEGTQPESGGFSAAFVCSGQDAAGLFNEVNGCYCALLEWGYRLREALQAANPIREVFSVGHSLYPRQFCLINHFFEVIAATEDLQAFKRTISPNPEELLVDEAFINTEKYTDLFLLPVYSGDSWQLSLNIHTEHNFQLRVFAEVDSEQVSEGEKQLFRELCAQIKTAYGRHLDGQLHRRQHDPIHSMLRKLLLEKPAAGDGEFWKGLAVYGWKREHQYRIVLIDIARQKDLKVFPVYLCAKLETDWKDSYALKTEVGIVWVINQSLSLGKRSVTDLFQSLAVFLRDTVTKAGVSEGFEDLTRIGEHYYQAQTALRLGQGTNPDFWYYKFEDYIVAYILESITGNVSKESLYYKGIKKLRQYDEENGTDLLPTFRHFAECIFSTGTAAEKAYVHRSTLIRRLEKIKAICGFDLTDMDEVIHVLISFRLMKTPLA